jgi:hypothetical protein
MMCRWDVDPLDVEDTENSSSSPNTTDVGITFVPSATGYDTSLRTPLNIEWPDYLAVRDFEFNRLLSIASVKTRGGRPGLTKGLCCGG